MAVFSVFVLSARKKEVLAVRKKDRVPVRRLILWFIKFGHLKRIPAGGWNPEQRPCDGRSKHHDIVAIPGATVAGGCLRKSLWRRAIDSHFFQLAAGKQRDESTVRCPEGKLGSLGAWQNLTRHPIERTEPQGRSAFVGIANSDHVGADGRQGKM